MSIQEYVLKPIEAIKIDYHDCRFYENVDDDTESVYREIYVPIPEAWKQIDLEKIFKNKLPTNDFYLVKYVGTDHISWCPAEYFEEIYKLVEQE